MFNSSSKAFKKNLLVSYLNNMGIRLEKYSFRFAEKVLKSKLALKQEIESILLDPIIDIANLSRLKFNEILKELFIAKGWNDQPHVFGDVNDPTAKLDFFKERIGIEVKFGHSSFIGIDLLKFQVSSYSNLDTIDIGIYVVTTKRF
jgi:hypothetical protein